MHLHKLLPVAARVEHALMTIIYLCCCRGPRSQSVGDLSNQNKLIIRERRQSQREKKMEGLDGKGDRDKKQVLF